jgi:hypothetical protein
MFGFRLAEILGWLALTFVAGLVVYASRAPLDGARSTLSRWMDIFSRKGSPIATWRPSFDRFARYVALGIWEIGTLLLALNYLFDQRVIVRYEAGPLLPDQMFHFNAYLTNRGALNDIQWRGGAHLTWRPMRAFMANIVFDEIYRSFSSKPEPDRLGGGEIQRNYSNSWLTAGGPNFSQSEIDSFVAGRDNMHLMLVIRQKAPWSKQWTYTESCVEFMGNGETLLCANGHNRTFAESEIQSDCSSKFPPLIASLDQVLASDPKMVATSGGLMVSPEEIWEVFHKYFPVEKCKIEDIVAIARTSRFFVKSFQWREDYVIEFSSDGASSRPGYLVQIAIDPKTGDFARPSVSANRYAPTNPRGGEAIP